MRKINQQAFCQAPALVACAIMCASMATAQVDTVRVSDTSDQRFHAVLQQTIQRQGLKTGFVFKSGFVSTGFAVGPRTVLTSAHNLHSPFVSRVVSYTGRVARNGNANNGTVKLEARRAVRDNAWVNPRFRFRFRPFRGFAFGRDYAVLNSDTGTSIPARFELALADTIASVGDSVFIAGYPAKTKDGSHLFLSRGTITSIEGSTLHYTNWTETGFSGSPVWVMKNGRPMVIGIHAGVDKQGPVAKKVDAALCYKVARITVDDERAVARFKAAAATPPMAK